jgi:hypothetical protein
MISYIVVYDNYNVIIWGQTKTYRGARTAAENRILSECCFPTRKGHLLKIHEKSHSSASRRVKRDKEALEIEIIHLHPPTRVCIISCGEYWKINWIPTSGSQENAPRWGMRKCQVKWERAHFAIAFIFSPRPWIFCSSLSLALDFSNCKRRSVNFNRVGNYPVTSNRLILRQRKYLSQNTR